MRQTRWWRPVELEPVSLRACRKTSALGYVDDGNAVNTYTTDAPYRVAVDLARIDDLLA